MWRSQQASHVLAFLLRTATCTGAAWAVLGAGLSGCVSHAVDSGSGSGSGVSVGVGVGVGGGAMGAVGGEFRVQRLPGAHGQTLLALRRAPRAAPLRYRVIVVPGSGCA
ncbi:MAG: hypothetical protein K2X65_09835, partial [Burkholderiaceae bacterium]|nr:hypothetical protein [Burkholderiaceae bacterium]